MAIDRNPRPQISRDCSITITVSIAHNALRYRHCHTYYQHYLSSPHSDCNTKIHTKDGYIKQYLTISILSSDKLMIFR